MNSSQNRCVKYHHIYVDNATIEHNSKNVMAKVAKLYVYAHKRTMYSSLFSLHILIVKVSS